MNNDFFIIIELIRNDGSIIVNKSLARNIGLNEAILYSELLSKYIYFSKRCMLDCDGYFFNTVENIEEDTTLTKKQQIPAIKNLEKLGLIKKKIKGLPPKRFFKIIQDFNLIKKYLNNGTICTTSELEQKGTIVGDKKELLKVTKGNTNNTNINNTKNNNKNNTKILDKKKNEIINQKTENHVVVFLNDLKNNFKEKYNSTLSKSKLIKLIDIYGLDKIKEKYNIFDDLIKDKNIDNLTGFFYKSIESDYKIQKEKNIKKYKPQQILNYTQREYDDDFFENLYDNQRFYEKYQEEGLFQK